MAKNANKTKKKTGTVDTGSTGGETSLRTLVADLRKQTIIGNDDTIATNFILTNILKQKRNFHNFQSCHINEIKQYLIKQKIECRL